MLGVGSAATIAEKDELAALRQGLGGTLRKRFDAGQQLVREALLYAAALAQLGLNGLAVGAHLLFSKGLSRAQSCCDDGRCDAWRCACRRATELTRQSQGNRNWND